MSRKGTRSSKRGSTAQVEEVLEGERASNRVRVSVDGENVLLAPWTGAHHDQCNECDKPGSLLCCGFCNLVFHLNCTRPRLKEVPSEKWWICGTCVAEVRASKRQEEAGRERARKRRRETKLIGVRREDSVEGVPQWRAFIAKQGRVWELGLHNSAEEAAAEHDKKALQLFGDSASLNFGQTIGLGDDGEEAEYIDDHGRVTKGVRKSFHQWRAEVKVGNCKRHLGFFDSRSGAAKAYNRSAVYYHGPHAILNAMDKEQTVSIGDDSTTSLVPPQPVRVPRNKAFTQVLAGAATVEGGEGSLVAAETLERRKRQMVGSYCEPLLGDRYQCKDLPVVGSWLDDGEARSQGNKEEGRKGTDQEPSVSFEAMWRPLKEEKEQPTSGGGGGARIQIAPSQLLSMVPPAKVGMVMTVLCRQKYNALMAARILASRYNVTVPGVEQHTRSRRRGVADKEQERQEEPTKRELQLMGVSAFTKAQVKQATEAFATHGRDLAAVSQALGWDKKQVVAFYYTVWKYSYGYEMWKVNRRKRGAWLPAPPGTSVHLQTPEGGQQQQKLLQTTPRAQEKLLPPKGANQSALAGVKGKLFRNGGGASPATTGGGSSAAAFRWRGSRLRTLKEK